MAKGKAETMDTLDGIPFRYCVIPLSPFIAASLSRLESGNLAYHLAVDTDGVGVYKSLENILTKKG